MKNLLYVGMDVHKESITLAATSDGEEIRHIGTILNQTAVLGETIRKLSSSGEKLCFVYEAGPGGFALYRHLRQAGHACMVAAPSLIPRKPGDRVKTDKRDAVMLTRLFRAGELTGIYVPDLLDVSRTVADISWKAQVRLCGRYQRLLQKENQKGKS